MKTKVKSIILFLITAFVFSSCRTYQVMHYKNTELDKVSSDIDNYKVYLHDKKNLYQVVQPSISDAGVKGQLNPITDPATVKEIKNPKTPKELKKHRYDLNLYTKAEIKDSTKDLMLKKSDITEVTHMGSKSNLGEIMATTGIFIICTALWVGIIASFQKML